MKIYGWQTGMGQEFSILSHSREVQREPQWSTTAQSLEGLKLSKNPDSAKSLVPCWCECRMAQLLWKPAWQLLTGRCIFLTFSRNVTPIYSRKTKLMFTQKSVCECWQYFISNHSELKTTQISCGVSISNQAHLYRGILQQCMRLSLHSARRPETTYCMMPCMWLHAPNILEQRSI